jgi:signal transduction histidine kinase
MLAGLLAGGAGWWVVRATARRDARMEAHLAARLAGRVLRERVERRVGIVQALALHWPAADRADSARWREQLASVLRVDGIRSMHLVAPDGRTVWSIARPGDESVALSLGGGVLARSGVVLVPTAGEGLEAVVAVAPVAPVAGSAPAGRLVAESDAAAFVETILPTGGATVRLAGGAPAGERTVRWSVEAGGERWPLELDVAAPAGAGGLAWLALAAGALAGLGGAWVVSRLDRARDETVALREHIDERERTMELTLRNEEQARQAQKMEALGRLAGGVAHDFNNILTAIQGCADLLLMDLERDDPRRDDAREIKKAAQRAASLTAQLLAFSRQQAVQPRHLDLNASVAELEKMLRRVIGADVAFATELGAGLGTVHADPGQLQQLVVNLVVNASDAMPAGGRLTIATADVPAADAARLGVAGLAERRYAVLRVRDSGHGMDAATRARIFEPFFTTKRPGKGTGLGLATVYAVVQQCGGAIDVESAVGIGTTVAVYLPAHAAAVEPVVTGIVPAAARGRGETVLLAEDEDAVRDLTARLLELHGYTVLEARDGREALAIGAQHRGRIDVLLTDVVMPELNGKELVELLRAHRPGLPVVYCSGYTNGEIDRRGALDPDAVFLQKPFSPADLLAQVGAALGRAGAAA